MKLKKNISVTLATASAALLSGVAHTENEHDVGDWDVSAALLFYQESDDRVQAIEPIIQAKKHIDTDETLTLKLTLDSLTGASPSGAVASDRPQTFTRPSGNGQYTVVANEYPLDDSFLDTRYALSTTWDKPIADHWRMTLNNNISFEYDYRSFSVGSTFAYDTNNKNTTYTTGLSLGFDQITPEGDIPIAFGRMAAVGEVQPRQGSSDDKLLIDALFGVTQVINKYSLFQLNYSVSMSDGYLTDPFKVISVVDPVTGVPLFENATEVNLPTVLFENRPDSRLKHAFYGMYKRWLKGGDVLDASYRLMIDDWGITSHTIDTHYRWALNNGMYLQPHLRIYQQSEADFYTPFFISGTAPTAGNASFEASADTRLGEFMAYTVGLEVGADKTNANWSAAIEYYLQQGDEPTKFGELNNQELVPDVDALMLRFTYDF
jgi:hypothetical protein